MQENSLRRMSSSKDSIIKKKVIIIGEPVFSAAENLKAAIFLQAGQALILQVQQLNKVKL